MVITNRYVILPSILQILKYISPYICRHISKPPDNNSMPYQFLLIYNQFQIVIFSQNITVPIEQLLKY